MSLTLDMNVGHTARESRSVRAQALVAALARIGVRATLGRLQFGDAAWEGNGPTGSVKVGMELKTLEGLLTDRVTGRFAGHQVPGMQAEYQYRYLVVEGPGRPASDGLIEVPLGPGRWAAPPSAMMYIDFLEYLNTVAVQGGFQVVRTGSKLETAYVIAAEYKWWSKPWDSHRSLKVFNEANTGTVLLTDPSLLRLWAKDLPKVGWERSEAVERKFKSPLAMAQASVEEWQSVPGIGEGISWLVWRAIRGLVPKGRSRK
jgi:ERCC4-type nuclease